MLWKIGDIAICVTPGSAMENKEVTILTLGTRHLGKRDLVYEVDPGFVEHASEDEMKA